MLDTFRGVRVATGPSPDQAQRLHGLERRGAFGSPTFFVGKEIWFGKEHLRDVEEEIVRLLREVVA